MAIAKKTKGKIQTKQIDFDSLCRFSSKVLDEPKEEVSFLGVDPELLPQAKNIIEWIETPGFLHSQEDLNPNKPFLYPKSHGILRDYFELLCPYCNDLSAVKSGLVHRDDEIRFEYARDVESGLPTFSCALCGVSFLDALRANRLVNYIEMALCVGMRAGKLLSTCTPIPTPGGWKTIGDIEVGDTVFDDQGRPCEVLEVSQVETEAECFKVSFSDGFEVIADRKSVV